MKKWQLFFETFADDKGYMRAYSVLGDSSYVTVEVNVEARRKWLNKAEVAMCELLGAESLTLLSYEYRARNHKMYKEMYDQILATSEDKYNHATCGFVTLLFDNEDDDLDLPEPSWAPDYYRDLELKHLGVL